MATIKSQMTLNDGMSSVLKKIAHALDITLASFEQVQQASGKAIDTHLLEEGRGLIVESVRDIEQMEDAYRQAAQEEEKLNQGINQGTSAMDGMLGKVMSVVAAYASLSTTKNFALDSMKAADVQIGAQVQLKTVMGNMGSLDYYDQVLDKASAIQGKGIYGDEAMIAGAGELATYFSDGEAILSMMDTLTNYAAGMSGGGALDTTAMVDYATGIGKIMSGSYDAMTKKGFEFSEVQKAIIEGSASEAQIVAELGAEYLDMSSDMQAAAVINSVIAEGWDGLYEAMSNTPEGKLIQLNNTLGDIQEVVGAGIYPAVINLVDAVQQNAPQIETAALGLATILGTIINIVAMLVNGAFSFGAAVAENWSWIEPIVWGLVTALAVYAAYLGVVKTYQLLAAAAQWAMNSSLLACPITWVVIGVIALATALVSVIRYFDIFGAKSTSVFGTLTGCINVAIQFFVNLGMTAANIALGIWKALGAACSNIGTAFHNVIANVQGWFYGLLSDVLTVVAGIAGALNALPFVSFDYSGIVDQADAFAAKSAEAYGSIEEYQSIADAFSEGFGTFDAFSQGWAADAFNAGASWGDGVADKVSGMFDGLSYEPGTIEGYANAGMGIDSFTMGGLGNDVGTIADNTGGMADALKVTGEELKYLRDIAERDAINRFTTAEVKIDMTGMTNKIDSGMDLDGVIRELTDGFSEALATAAEGVHD